MKDNYIANCMIHRSVVRPVMTGDGDNDNKVSRNAGSGKDENASLGRDLQVKIRCEMSILERPYEWEL